MSKTDTAPKGFNFDAVLAVDTADLVLDDGSGGKWTITFAGPGHPQAVALATEASRKRLREEQAIERARVNGRKWSPEEVTPEQRRRDNVLFVVDRIVTWTGLVVGGNEVAFSRETALELLSNPKAGAVYGRMFDFLTAEEAFTKGSAAK
jgi:hypothetical protein